MSQWLRRMAILGSLGLAGTLAGCGTHTVSVGTRTAGLVMSIQSITPIQAQEFMIQTSLRNRGSRPVYITQRAFRACAQSSSGGLRGHTLCFSPASSTWEGKTIGKFLALPMTLKPEQSIQVNVVWPDLYIVPMSPVQIRLAITSSVQTSKSIPATLLNPYSENLIYSLLVNLTHAVDTFHNSPYNPNHFWPTYDTYVSQSPLQPTTGTTARQIDLSAVNTKSVTFIQQSHPQTPDVLSSEFTGAPWGEAYYGVTSNGTVFLTFVPPNVAATDSNNGDNMASTGNGAWTSGNVRVFTVAHPNNGVLLSSIWG